MRSERGVVGANLVLVIAFALFAVIMLTRVTVAASQIDDKVETITSDVGPGSNVSHLDETQKLNDIGAKAEAILAAADEISPTLGNVDSLVKNVDSTVSSINSNATEINSTVKSINSTANALLPVVNAIHGTGGLGGGGVEAINLRVIDVANHGTAIAGDLHNTLIQTNGIVVSARQICQSTLLLGSSCG